MRRHALLALLLGACAHGVSVEALIAKDGLDGAADELRFRVASDTHDRDALAALGAVEVRRGRPGAALEALDRAALLGGPPGGKLPAADRARLAGLYLARARERAGRGAPAAVADLDRARALGADVPDGLARDAAAAAALADARHADPKRRARGIAALVAPLPDAPSEAELDRYGAQGAWLWDRGAKRAALEVLDAWVAHRGLAIAFQTRPADGGRIAERWLDAHGWWGSDDLDLPGSAWGFSHDLGASQCAMASGPGAGCSPSEAVDGAPIDGPSWEPMLWRQAELRGWRSGEPAWLVIAARAWLRGDAPSYLAAVRAHVAPERMEIPAWAIPTLARVDGQDPRRFLDAAVASIDSGAHAPAGARLVVAIELAADGRPRADVEAVLGADRGPLGDALVARLEPTDAPAPDLAHAAAARALRGQADPRASEGDVAAIAAAYLREPAAADRLADDWIAKDVDVATRAPIAAALFAALDDPARARALWQRAADASPGELRVMRGLALAAAATDDPDAAMIFATTEAAASGDAAPALVEVARALAAHGRYDHALELVHLALQLVPRDDAAPLYDLAIAWSRAEGKDTAELDAARDLLPAAAAAAPEPPAGAPAALAAQAADPRVPDDAAAAAWSEFTAATRRAR